jgi:hypothetical protein
MASIIDLLASSLGGSILGTVGAVFNKVQDAKQALRMADHEYRMTQINQSHEKDMAQLQLNVKIEEGKAASAMEEIKGSYTTLQTSIESDRATYSLHSGNKWLIFVDVIRGTMRSWITTALLFYLGIFLFYITNRYQVGLSQAQVADIVIQIIHCLIGGASLALAWWFGSRNINQKG